MEYECRLDSRDPEAWLECTNPAMYSNLTTGLHTFEVRAIAGEIGAFEGDPTPARYTWRVGPDPDGPARRRSLRPGEHHPDRQRGRVGRPGQPARELHLRDRARHPLGRERRRRGADRAAERARLLPLPDPERRAGLRARVGHAAPLRRLADRGPDARGRAARGHLEGELAHLGQPARSVSGRGRRDDRVGRGLSRVGRQGARRGDQVAAGSRTTAG